LALRQSEGLIGSIMRLLAIDLPVPDRSTLSRRACALSVQGLPATWRKTRYDRLTTLGGSEIETVDNLLASVPGVGKTIARPIVLSLRPSRSMPPLGQARHVSKSAVTALAAA
jgi:Transposase DDE domain